MNRVYCKSYGMITPLGNSPEEVYDAVLNGRTKLVRHEGSFGCKEPFVASLFDRNDFHDGKWNMFETLSVLSARQAIDRAGISPESDRVGFVFSTTKGDVEHIGTDDVCLACSAEKVVRAFNNPNRPVVVSNACISGAAAAIQARRMLLHGDFDYVVLIGTEVQSRFIVSGFQSLKALSSERCRPFDKSRDGLNLGEGSAAMVLGGSGEWEIVDGVIRNDANHISGPSRTGEGSYNALKYVLNRTDLNNLAFLSVHGTATLYNDEMEAIAISRAGLSEVPIFSLKGYLGHSMGAAGVIESILSMMACADGVVLPTLGFSESGVSKPVNISSELRRHDKGEFIKLLSGFGGVNSAILYRKCKE